MDVGNLISGSSAFSKTSLYIREFTVHVLLKPALENFEHYLNSMWDECNCAVVWAFFGIAFLWNWNENWTFPVLWPLLSFPNLLVFWVQHFHSIIFQNCPQFIVIHTLKGFGIVNKAEVDVFLELSCFFHDPAHVGNLLSDSSTFSQHWNQIDCILCSQRWRSSIQSAKTRPGADCGSDDELLIAKSRLKWKK